MDAYSYLFRGEVFANAQTGNILLCSVALSQGEWGVAVQYAFPVLAFGLGILMTFLIRQRFRNRTNRIHWRQLGVLAEILLLTLVAFLPAAGQSVGQQSHLPGLRLSGGGVPKDSRQRHRHHHVHRKPAGGDSCRGGIRLFQEAGGPQPGHYLFYGDSGLCPGGGFGEPGHCPVGDLGHSGQQRPSAGLLWPDVFPGKGRGRSWHSLSSTT